MGCEERIAEMDQHPELRKEQIAIQFNLPEKYGEKRMLVCSKTCEEQTNLTPWEFADIELPIP